MRKIPTYRALGTSIPLLLLAAVLTAGCNQIADDLVDKTGTTPSLLSASSPVRPGSLALVVVAEISGTLENRAGLSSAQARLASLEALRQVEAGKTVSLRLADAAGVNGTITPFEDDIQLFLSTVAKGFMNGLGTLGTSPAKTKAAIEAVSGGLVESFADKTQSLSPTEKTALLANVSHGLIAGIDHAMPQRSVTTTNAPQSRGIKSIMAAMVSSLGRSGLLKDTNAGDFSGAVVAGGIGGLSEVSSLNSKGASAYGEVLGNLMSGTTSALADADLADAGRSALLVSSFTAATSSFSHLTITDSSTQPPRQLSTSEMAQLLGPMMQGGISGLAEKKAGNSPTGAKDALGAMVKGALQGLSTQNIPFAERDKVISAISNAAVTNASTLNLPTENFPSLVEEIVTQTAVSLNDLGYDKDNEDSRGQMMADVVGGVFHSLKETGKSNENLAGLLAPMITRVFTNVDKDQFNGAQVATIQTYFNARMLETFASDPVITYPLDEKLLKQVTAAAASPGTPAPTGPIGLARPVATVSGPTGPTGTTGSTGTTGASDPGPEITGATISISAGAAFTSTTTVTLNLTATNAAQMYITTTAGCSSGGSFETFATTRIWQLVPSGASAKVYVKFKNSAGTLSSCIDDTIGYDSTNPGQVSAFVDGTSSTVTSSPTITWTAATDADSGIASYEIALGSSAGQSDVKDWTDVGNVTSFQVSGLSLTAGTTYFATIRAKDAAGNTGTAVNGDGFVPYTSASTMSMGASFTCAAIDGNKAKCWGNSDYGQLGRGNTTTVGDFPNQMGSNLAAIDLGSGVTVSALASRSNSTCALTATNSLLCWGENDVGQLGRGDTTIRGNMANQMGANLQAVPLGTGKTAKNVSLGSNFSCAILNDDTLKCWGGNSNGQLGQQHLNSLGDNAGELGDSLAAINLGSGRTALKVTAGHNSTVCAVLDNGNLKCWGRNFDGALGMGSGAVNWGGSANQMGDNLPAVNLGSGRTAKSVSVNNFSVCALLDNNNVKCWGTNTNGELGNGTSTRLGISPSDMGDNLAALDLGSGRSAKALAGGSDFTCAILDNDSVKCWGLNSSGQLGLGDTASRGDNAGEMGDNLPAVDLGSGRTAKALFCGATHVCAILDNDRVKCWGDNNSGQLGQGSFNTLGDGAGELGDNLPYVEL